ncbi:type I site-specific restriction-modification system, S subunit [Haemophilus parahaemolyticus]|uniref:Type I site-specific restriction-modification system, S subunit n=1 Tax=Haemophilus parahaemolyticus TaxID=735 RepID=A0A377HY84_HAEPH|nr:restriction endonuclease subunit S [Haemophilus parahaemolyticus]STO63233.1 type I site-specific restriction-modification system, S subunit [Haemophilus parahaemolyticus]
MFKAYQEYKNSGVEWLGDVPKNWNTLSLKRITKEHSGNGFPVLLQGKNGNIPFLKVSDISQNKSIFIKEYNNSVNEATRIENKWNLVPKNSIVTAKIGEALRKNNRRILSQDSIIDNNCLGIESINIDLMFNFYLHLVIDFDWFANEGAVPSVSMNKYRNFKIALPNKEEQTQIATFLDQETQKIDHLISKQEKLIELLEEQRKSIISHAVTKGINPNAEMKESGVEWLGEVPEGWEMKPFYSLYQRIKITNKPKEMLLSIYRDYGVIPKDSRDDNHNVASEDLSPYQFVDINYLVVNKMKAWQGSLAISDYKGIISPAYFIYEPKHNYYHKYIHFLLRSIFYIQTYKNISKGIRVGQWDLDDYQFNRIKILIPPLKEQIAIVNYIEEENNKINHLIQKQTTLIKKLKEYRASIISHAVTGKIDVRNLI